jgi:hypothetical protein
VEIILNPAQYDKLKNSPLYYNSGARYVSKENYYICDCDPATHRQIKQLVDEPRPQPPE